MSKKLSHVLLIGVGLFSSTWVMAAVKEYDLTIAEQTVNITGKPVERITVNGKFVAPLLEFEEGDEAVIRVHNKLKNQDSSIHWHGLLLPGIMDGVPGFNKFNGIAPNKTYEYKFKVRQNGTYWYHSHSKGQEQDGLYGAFVIYPKDKTPLTAAEKTDKDYVVLLSDFHNSTSDQIMKNIKKEADYYQNRRETVFDVLKQVKRDGLKATWQDRSMWNQMRMLKTDMSDVTGYTFLMNGKTPQQNWTGNFKAGEKVRLRFINASAMSFFDVRIPNLKMTVVSADGQPVKPVPVDEFRIGTAETYDVIVTPTKDAHTIFAQNIDRSGYVAATLATKEGARAATPAMDKIEWLTMADMMGAMGANGYKAKHAKTEYDFKSDMRVDSPRMNLDDPGINLRNINREVLNYSQLRSVDEAIFAEQRKPTREIELHLTGNMERYIWAFDGVKFSEATPVNIKPNERVRITLVNDTMMNHPMHLHGMWSDLRMPNGEFQVRKHTMMVQPAQKISFDVTGEAGRWAWHCHLLYHMEAGMFREVADRKSVV